MPDIYRIYQSITFVSCVLQELSEEYRAANLLHYVERLANRLDFEF